MLKKTQNEMKTDMKNTINQIKNSVESLTEKMDHMEDRLSGYEDKTEESGHSVKGIDKF